jgi:two-component system response regulator YesN
MPETVLIVDDEMLIRKTLTKMIASNDTGWEVIGEASNGVEALQMIGGRKPDLVITDVRMPLMNGLELAERLYAGEREIKVIILTGYKDFEYAQAAIKFGVIDFLLKPCPEEEVCHAIAKARHAVLESKERQQLERRLLGGARMDGGGAEFERVSFGERTVTAHSAGIGEIGSMESGMLPYAKSETAIQRALHYIKENYSEKCSLQEVASLVYLNHKYFSLLFKRETGESFVNHVTKIRLEQAALLLNNTDWKVTSVAAAVGYDDPNYFITVFRKKYSLTPGEYRKRYQN